jgi:hypothetical protein
MGLAKTFKTGAIVGSYPKPLLYFGFDNGGLDIIPTSKTDGFDISQADIDRIAGGKFSMQATKPVTHIDYSSSQILTLATDYLPTKSQAAFMDFHNDYNKLAGKAELPYKTIVFDSVSGLMNISLQHMSSFNPNALGDARVWAANIGQKVRQLILSATCLPTHVVFIMHSEVEKDELTGRIREIASVYSNLRNEITGLFSQVFYATKDPTGKPVIWTTDKEFVRGIGPRWPVGLPPVCAPDFNSIYGKELA